MVGGRGAEGVAGAAAGELLLEGDAPLLVLRRLLVILGNEKDGGEAGRSIIEKRYWRYSCVCVDGNSKVF